MARSARLGAVAITATLAGAAVLAQRPDAFLGSRDHPAIEYSTRPATTPVTGLNEQLEAGAVQLEFEPSHGYLRSVLERLHVPIDGRSSKS